MENPMPQLADQGAMEAFNAQQGMPTKGIQAAFYDGSEPDILATEGCKRDCVDQHPHLETCVIDGCPPNCTLTHQHGKDCPSGCQDRHHNYVCQNRHHVKAAGTPRFRDAIYLKKTIPGDILNVIDRPKRPGDEEEFPEAWKRYQEKSESPGGTPLESLTFLTPAQRAEFRAANCFSAEDIASMNDAVAQKFMGIHGIRQKTKDFLAAVNGNAPIQKANEKIAALEKRLRELETKR
jgi:hypothetical protein